MPGKDVQAADFNRGYVGLAHSPVYRDAIRAGLGELPDWVVPFGFTSLADLERIANELAVDKSDTFVDLACGLGGLGLWVAERTGASLAGVDFSGVAVEAAEALARERRLQDRSRFVVADATETGLASGEFAAVMSIDALQMIDPHKVTREIARLLTPGGMAVVRTWEGIVDELPRHTMVHDYRPIFEEARLRVCAYEEIAGARDRELALFRALDERADELRNEIGAAGDDILKEASDSLARAQEPPRLRKVFLTAKKT